MNAISTRALWVGLVTAMLLAALATRDAGPWERLATVAGFVIGGSFGMLVSRRFWWLGIAPLLIGVGLGMLCVDLFGSGTSYGGGDWSVSAVILVAGLWCAVLGTIVELIVVAARAARKPPEHAAR